MAVKSKSSDFFFSQVEYIGLLCDTRDTQGGLRGLPISPYKSISSDALHAVVCAESQGTPVKKVVKRGMK